MTRTLPIPALPIPALPVPAFLVSALLASALLAACAESAPLAGNGRAADTPAHTLADHDTAEAGNSPDARIPGDTIVTIATGRFISVVPEGTYATLDHDPIPAINMGAMKMGFDIDPALDLSRYSEGDALRFRLETSEATGFLITHICRPATDGNDCLE